MSKPLRCVVCGLQDFESLTPPSPTRSITTGGIIVHEPLRKEHCWTCGVLSQAPFSPSAKVDLYLRNYGLYHRRPGTMETELARYADIANWIFAELGDFAPKTVLDVGCAGGMLLDAMRSARPSLEYA